MQLWKLGGMLRSFPNTSIGVVLGLGGNAILWEALSGAKFSKDALGRVPHDLNWFFWVAAICVLALVMLTYTVKAVLHFDVVKAEFHHPVRSHFFNGPQIAFLMLSLGTPKEEANVHFLRAVWVISFLLQTGLTQTFYARWLFSETATLSVARPQYLLSTVGWFLLAVLAQATGLDDAWRLPLAAVVFGMGVAMYSIVIVAVFLNIKNAPGEKGQPALFLIIAPSSVAAIALAGFDGGNFNTASSALVGYNFTILLVLCKLKPKLLEAERGSFFSTEPSEHADGERRRPGPI